MLGRRRACRVDLATSVGSLTLPNPVMTASGTAGHGTELAAHVDLSRLGAVVVKSLAAYPWPGNPRPRVHETPAGMINSVGLQGPGLDAWLDHDLPRLVDAGARVVASIWGRSVADFERAADRLADAPAEVIAVEVNVSCPNVEDRNHVFSHSPAATADVVAATSGCGRPRWAKLSPNVADIAEIAAAAADAGAEAVTLVNTLLGMLIDVEARRPLLGGGGGGLSGPAIRPVAVRAVYDCRAALPDLPIVGVGGVASARDAIELLLAGANAVQVGTATFADPRAVERILDGVVRWCDARDIARVASLTSTAHENPQSEPGHPEATSP